MTTYLELYYTCMSGLNKKKNLLFNSKWRGSEVGDSPVKEHIRVTSERTSDQT